MHSPGLKKRSQYQIGSRLTSYISPRGLDGFGMAPWPFSLPRPVRRALLRAKVQRDMPVALCRKMAESLGAHLSASRNGSRNSAISQIESAWSLDPDWLSRQFVRAVL